MKPMKLFLVGFILLSFSACKKSSSLAVEDLNTIQIGEVQTMTGSEAAFGMAIHRGIELAVDQINQAGGIKGKKLKIITVDDQGRSEDAATATTKLITQDHVVAILGALASSRSLAMGPIVQSKKIPMITPTATNPRVTEVGDYVFRVCFVDPFQGQVVARFARDHLKVTRAAVLRDVKSDYSIGLADFFSSTFKKNGGQIVVEQSYTSGDIDFKSQLTAIRTLKPEVIFIPGYYTEVGLIVRQARELGITAPLLGGDGWSSPKLAEVARDALENSYYSDHYSSDDKSPLVQGFISQFKSRYGSTPDGIAALGYDSALVLANAIRNSDSVTSENIRNALAKTDQFPGVTGKITMDKNRNPIKSAAILKFQNGLSVYQTTIDP